MKHSLKVLIVKWLCSSVQECDLHATFDTWLHISTGPLAALVSKLMLCFHHLEQVRLL